MYSARHYPKWFSDAITRARESRTRNRRVQVDSSAGERSVEARQPCHREETTSRCGKAKRVMVALTTESDTGPDSPGETDRDKRPPRQVSLRVFHAPDPHGIAPPFPLRIAQPRGTRRIDPALPLFGDTTDPRSAHTPRKPLFGRELPPPPLTPQLLLSTRTLPVVSHLAPPTPAPVLPSASPTNSEIHHLHDDRLPTSSSSQAQHRFRRAFGSKMQVEYRILDMRHVPRVQPLHFSAHTDRTAATQLLVHSMRDALSGFFDVADPSGSVTMRFLTWVSGWHAPLLKLTKAPIVPNRDDTHTLHRLVDDLFDQLQERLASGVDGPAAFRTLLTDVADYFDRAPRGAALETLQSLVCPLERPSQVFYVDLE